MYVFGVWENPNVTVAEALLIALIAISIVFLTLLIVIGATSGFQKGMEVIQKKTSICPRPENRILESDDDAVVAVLVATIDFHKATGKEARVVSIEKTEE